MIKSLVFIAVLIFMIGMSDGLTKVVFLIAQALFAASLVIRVLSQK